MDIYPNVESSIGSQNLCQRAYKMSQAHPRMAMEFGCESRHLV